jgi:hypothetical protein
MHEICQQSPWNGVKKEIKTKGKNCAISLQSNLRPIYYICWIVRKFLKTASKSLQFGSYVFLNFLQHPDASFL